MKVFIDTNIILEFLMRRERVDVVETLLESLKQKGETMYMTVGSFYSLLYIIDNYLRKELELKKPERIAATRAIAAQVLEDFVVAGQDNDSLLQGVKDLSFTDLEDSCQYQAAKRNGCECLITFNVKDYAGLVRDDSMKILLPQEYLLNYYHLEG